MTGKPFLKWAGGKRWLVDREDFKVPQFSGKYIEPFLGGGAVFFHLSPKDAILSDINTKLIDTYSAIQNDWQEVWAMLSQHQKLHSKEYYYIQRKRKPNLVSERAALFLYLNRACWNGLYRENLRGEFNVPIGSKTKILMDDDDFEKTSSQLKRAKLMCCDFTDPIRLAGVDDFVFVDPPYTTAHNMNGFVKYNQKIFSWSDQIRLRDEVLAARQRGAHIVITNACHESVIELYSDSAELFSIPRSSIISGKNHGRSSTEELLVYLNP